MMKRVLLFCMAFCVASSVVFSGELKYSVAEIPRELLANAKAVVRNETTVLTVLSASESIEKVDYAITILNMNGIDHSRFIQYYDKYSQVNRISCVIYDAKGNEVKKITKSEIQDYSAIANFSLYEDNRVKFIDPEYKNFPFTVAFSYEVKYAAPLDFPDWTPYEDFNISVERSQFKIVTPSGFKFNYLERNMNSNCVKSVEGQNNVYTWMLSGMPAIKEEPYRLPVDAYLPIVYTAPLNFEIEGYAGSFESWKSFGNWIGKLNEGRNKLSEETQSRIKNLVQGMDSDREKVRTLYEYLQNKTRYVSIQVGIGGWQPFGAHTVDALSYGDCKALTNYMKSMLDVVHVKSYYTLVSAGEDAAPVIKDFPSQQFNHVILCVPLNNDTIWLECTSQQIPFGYLGTFTDDRDALVITDAGGLIVHTKTYSKEVHQRQCKAVVTFDTTLNARVTVSTKYGGMFYDELFGVLHSDDADKKRFTQEHLHIPKFDLVSFSYNEERGVTPVIIQTLLLNIRDYVTVMRDRFILRLSMLNKAEDLPVITGDRKSDIYISRASMQVDTMIYVIPAAFTIEQVPQNVRIETRYGYYTTAISLDDRRVTFVRTLVMNKGIYPKSEYPDFVAFIEQVQKNSDGVQCILRRR